MASGAPAAGRHSGPASIWIDASVPVRTGMVTWPGDPPVRLDRVLDMAAGAEANLSRMDMSVHAGTHVDAPLHFLKDGRSVDEAPISALMGPARVIEAGDKSVIDAACLRAADPRPGERLLIKTRNSSRDWWAEPFDPDFVYLSTEAAELLARIRVQTVGVDYLSVAGFETNEAEVHRHLLGTGIWVIEGLHLGGAAAGRYEMICLPVNLAGCEGAPARVILRRINEPD